MCIYCGTAKYRKIYECHFGTIPQDETGRTYDIHHIDGNKNNNDPVNLKAVTVQEHYDIHYAQKDYSAALYISARLELSIDELRNLSSLRSLEMIENGTHPFLGDKNPVYKQLENGTHNSQNPIFCEEVRQRNFKLVEDGIHPFLGGELVRQRVKDGTFHLLKQNGGSEKARERALTRSANGTHNLQGGEVQRRNAKKQLENGKHISQYIFTCNICEKTLKGKGNIRHHFDNCKLSPTYDEEKAKLKPLPILECPHCGKIGKGGGMQTWHFDNCKTIRFKCY